MDDLSALGGASTISCSPSGKPLAVRVMDVTNKIMEMLRPFTPLLWVDEREDMGKRRPNFRERPYHQFRQQLEEVVDHAVDLANHMQQSSLNYTLRWFQRGEKFNPHSMEHVHRPVGRDVTIHTEYEVLATMLPGLIRYKDDGSEHFYISKAHVMCARVHRNATTNSS